MFVRSPGELGGESMNPSMPLISVIVPVYNVEKYLDRCLRSIVHQTYQNLEIILVNDGSTDKSLEICQRWAREYANIILITQENSGQATARNRGLEMPHGDYIGFVDSDDWISTDMYTYCMALMEKHDADIVQIDYLPATGDTYPANAKKETLEIYSNKEMLQYYMQTTTTTTGSYSVCRCLFQKQVLENIRFRDGYINEDIDYKYRAFCNAKKLVVSNQVHYFYFQSTGSTTTSGLKKRDFDLYAAAAALKEMTELEDYGTIRKLGRVKEARTPLSLLCKIAYYGVSDALIEKNSTIQQLQCELRDDLRILINSPLPLSRKFLAVMFSMNYRLTEILIHYAKQCLC